MEKYIDCRGLKCPSPVILTKKYFDEIESGEATAVVDNEVAKNNIVKFAASSGFKSEVEEKNSLYYIKITKEEIEIDKNCKCNELDFRKKSSCILISTNEFGVGDEKLGVSLMKSYLYALNESKELPETLLFLNSGVKLTIDSSEVLENLREMEKKGVEILSCGTCLDFYGIKDKLSIGEITNMYTIVEKMQAASNTIKL